MAPVLLVEDDAHDVELTVEALRRSNIANRVDVLRDGLEALDYLCGGASHPASAPLPALVLLDLRLPGLDGIELLKFIRSTPSILSVPVVVLTGSSEPADLLRAKTLGVNAYLSKPIDFPALIEAVAIAGSVPALV